jgi:acetate kinase
VATVIRSPEQKTMKKAAMTKESSTKPVNASILTINGGSSSIKFAVFEAGDSLRRILEGVISAAAGRVAVRVIRTDEERIIAETVCRVLGLGWKKEN